MDVKARSGFISCIMWCAEGNKSRKTDDIWGEREEMPPLVATNNRSLFTRDGKERLNKTGSFVLLRRRMPKRDTQVHR